MSYSCKTHGWRHKQKTCPKCCEHGEVQNNKLGYIAWHEWADEQQKQGIKQTQCPNCKLWLTPREWKP